jgi:hypothetical protein
MKVEITIAVTCAERSNKLSTDFCDALIVICTRRARTEALEEINDPGNIQFWS